jgi:sigma-54-specific transcriptional regulator
MEALAVAHLARSLALATRPATMTREFLGAAVEAHGLQGACCYRCDITGDRLSPVAAVNLPEHELPSLDMAELDNPLVYCLRQGKPCLVDNMAALVDVGKSFDALRQRWPSAPALLVVALKGAQSQPWGVVALLGAHATLRAWQADPVWNALGDMHQHLLARLSEQMAAEESYRYEHVVKRKLEADKSTSRARRLLSAEFVGESAAARRIRDDMLRLADSSLSTLVTGETGAGKDHAAWLIHQASSRGGAFVPVNCAAIPKDLIEAELFGSTRGAYTGANQARTGLVAEAHGGTLFLDEIGDMPLLLQGTLLRVLNEKKYRPVGSTKERESDFRLICATHQPLPQLIREGRFREDLYFRIRQQQLHLPPLRDRPEDIGVMAAHVLLQYNREQRSHIPGFAAPAIALLRQQPFPGNVRELRSLVLAAAERTAAGDMVSAQTVQSLLTCEEAPTAITDAALRDLLGTAYLPEAVDAFERLMIGGRLRQLRGSRAKAAQSLGIPKRTLAYKCLKWNLDSETDTP